MNNKFFGKKKIFLAIILLAILAIFISGCSDADTVSNNISVEADQFKIFRRVVFYNGITDKYILMVEGYCSLGNYDPDGELSVTCKTGPDSYVKHFLGLSDNVTYFAEQLQDAEVSSYQYNVVFKPLNIIPDIDIVK